MRERYVVDTNVLIAASAADPLTQKDWDATPKEVSYQRQVHQWLTAFEASTASWVLEALFISPAKAHWNGGATVPMYSKYQRLTSGHRKATRPVAGVMNKPVLDGQGKIEEEYRRRLRHPDYALLVLQYKWDTQAVHYVAVEYDSDGHGWLDEPLQSLVHDRADRKMVAAALAACQDHEPCAIAFAGDTDWHDWEDGLQEAGLCLEPIIPEWSGPKYRAKSRR